MVNEERGLLREIGQDARRQALLAFWRRWRLVIVAAGIAVSAVCAVALAWNYSQRQAALDANARLVGVMLDRFAADDGLSPETLRQNARVRAAELAGLAAEAPAETATLAYFAAARAALAAGEANTAAGYYQAAAATAPLPYLEQLAAVYAASLDPDGGIDRLRELASGSGPARFVARLHLAVLLSESDRAAAMALLQELRSDAGADQDTASVAGLLYIELQRGF